MLTMDCVYDTFDFLEKEPILSEVKRLRHDNGVFLHEFTGKLDKCDDEAKKKQLIKKSTEYATIVNLCDFFLKSMESDNLAMAVKKLKELNEQETYLIKKQEFEAAALVRDERNQLRIYLDNQNHNNDGK